MEVRRGGLCPKKILENKINYNNDFPLRCDEGGAEPSAQYRLPLEEEVGSHPGLEEMQEAVVQRKLRPTIPPRWRDHPVSGLV